MTGASPAAGTRSQRGGDCRKVHAAASSARHRCRSATSTTTCCARRTTNGPAASRRSARCNSRSISGVLTVVGATGMLKTYDLTAAAFRLGQIAEGGDGQRDAWPICSIARCARRASSASTSICHLYASAQAGDTQAHRRARATRRTGAGRARWRRQAGALGRAVRCSKTPADGGRDIVHILSIRSIHW